MNRKLVHLFSFFGLASPVIAVASVGATLLLSPGFNLSTQSLYALSSSDTSFVLFNSALGMTSAVLMMYSACLFEVTQGNNIGLGGSIAHLAASLSLLICGLLKDLMEPYSVYFWPVFFIAFPAAAAIIGVYHWQTGKKSWAALGWAAAVIAGGVWFQKFPSVGYSELISAGAVLLWQLPIAWSLFQESGKEEPLTSAF